MERLGYRPGLDSVRALAVLAVVGFHTWSDVAPGGWLGVDVFFVLSGFLITVLLVEEHERTGGIRLGAFCVRRVRRLMPAFLVCMAVAAPALALLSPSSVKQDTLNALPDLLTYRANVALVAGKSLGGFGHIWSLAEEEQFYLVWPVLLVVALRFGGRSQATLVAAAGGIASITTWVVLARQGVPPPRMLYSPDTRGLGLVLGCLLGLNARSWRPGRPLLIGACGLLAVLAFLPVASAIDPIEVVPAGVAAVTVVAAARYADGPLLTSRPLVGIGRLSYGVYLWHYPVAVVLVAHGLGHGPLLALSVTLVALALAAVSHRTVERRVRMSARRERETDARSPVAQPSISLLSP